MVAVGKCGGIALRKERKYKVGDAQGASYIGLHLGLDLEGKWELQTVRNS